MGIIELLLRRSKLANRRRLGGPLPRVLELPGGRLAHLEGPIVARFQSWKALRGFEAPHFHWVEEQGRAVEQENDEDHRSQEQNKKLDRYFRGRIEQQTQ